MSTFPPKTHTQHLPQASFSQRKPHPSHQQTQSVPAWPLSCPAHVLVIACLHIHTFPARPLFCPRFKEPTPANYFSQPVLSLVSCCVQPIRGPVGRLEDRRRGKGRVLLILPLFLLFSAASILCSHLLPGISPQMTPAPSCCPLQVVALTW